MYKGTFQNVQLPYEDLLANVGSKEDLGLTAQLAKFIGWPEDCLEYLVGVVAVLYAQ